MYIEYELIRLQFIMQSFFLLKKKLIRHQISAKPVIEDEKQKVYNKSIDIIL